jgi:hypothetical protein
MQGEKLFEIAASFGVEITILIDSSTSLVMIGRILDGGYIAV